MQNQAIINSTVTSGGTINSTITVSSTITSTLTGGGVGPRGATGPLGPTGNTGATGAGGVVQAVIATDASIVVSGTIANPTVGVGLVPVINGGTNSITQQAAINTLTGTQVSGKYLRSDGTNSTLSSIVAADVPTLNQNTSGSAASVTTNANLTGPITSTGNATNVASQTGTGSKFVMDTSPTIATPVINGTITGTGQATTPTASTIAMRDANGNLFGVNVGQGFTTTATAAGTTVLTVGSTQTQVFTGSTTQTITLPTTSIVTGADYIIINQSTGAVTVQSSGANTIIVLAAGTSASFIAVVTTPTTAAHWNSQYFANIVTSGKSLSVSNTLTLAGTDATTMTFPGSSDTVATLAATQTLTNKTIAAGSNTLSGITNTNLSGTAGITGANIAAGTITGANIASYSTSRSNSGTTVNETAAKIQTGWGYGQGTGTVYANATITYPVAFAGSPIVLISAAGFKDTSAPTSITDSLGPWEVLTAGVSAPGTTTCSVRIGAGGNTIASTRYILFTWIAIGT